MTHHPLLTQAELDLPDFVLLETAAELTTWMGRLSQSSTALAIDTETNGDNPRRHQICLIQLGVWGLPVCLIDVRQLTLSDLRPVAALLQQPRLKLLQNGKFDLTMLTAMGLPVRGPYADTLLQSRLLRCGEKVPHGLGDLARFYLGLSLDKGEQTSFLTLGAEPLTISQCQYAARDVKVLQPLWAVQQAALGSRRQDSVINALEQQLLPVLVDMELQGVGIQPTVLQPIACHWSGQVAAAAETVYEQLCPQADRPLSLFGAATPPPLNLNSTKQVRDTLSAAGLEPDDTPKALLKQVGRHPVVASLLLYKYRVKQQIWLKRLQSAVEDGRAYVTYNQCPRQHGRLGNSLKLEQWQQPLDLFPLWQPAPGHALLWCDLSTLPLQLLAHAAGEPRLLYDLKEGLEAPGLDSLVAIGCGVFAYRASGLQHWLWEQGHVLTVKETTRLALHFFKTYQHVERYHQTLKGSDFYKPTWLGRYRRLEVSNQRPSLSERVSHVLLTGASDLLKQLLTGLPTGIRPVLACASGLLVECSVDSIERQQAALQAQCQQQCQSAIPPALPIPISRVESSP